MMYEPFSKESANVTDRIAWALCQIIDDDAPLRWTRYRFAAGCIAKNPEVMADLQELAGSRPAGGEWSEERLRDEAKQRGWHVREGASVPTASGYWRHPFTVTASSSELCELLAAPTPPSGEDARRLDWMAHHGASLRHDQSARNQGWFVLVPFHTGVPAVDDRARHETSRDAVDAAIAASREPTP